ncbi:MAG: type II/IV secretion system ATPase subunit [Candidatus Thermoplasmatota archaeon]
MDKEIIYEKGISKDVSIQIVYDKTTHEYKYTVKEPELLILDSLHLNLVKDTLSRTLDFDFTHPVESSAELRDVIEDVIEGHMLAIDKASKEKIIYYLTRDFIGYGKIDPIMNDPLIEDISCGGPGVPIFLYHRDYESIETNISFATDEELDSFVLKLAQRCGKQVSRLNPIVDATLPNGSRLHATYGKEVTQKGSSFTIRKFREDPFTPPDLVSFGTLSAEAVAYLWLATQYGKSIMYCGGTACGKTTTLNAISLFIPSKARIISIEDTREINLPHKNWVAEVTRGGVGGIEKDVKEIGDIDMFDLMKSALRQRPQYLILGEIRGKEAAILFQAMATGHSTYTTMHADTVESIIYRLEGPPISLPRVLLQSLNIVLIQILVKKGEKNLRRVKDIYEVVGLAPNTMELMVNQVYRWDPEDDVLVYSGKSRILDEIKNQENLSDAGVKEEINRRIEVIEWMIKKKMRTYKEIGNVVASYYKDPKSTIEKLRSGE